MSSSFNHYDEAIKGPDPDPRKGILDVDRAALFEGGAYTSDLAPTLATQDPRRLDIAARALQESRKGIDGPIIIEPIMKRDREALRRPLPPNHI